MKRKLIALLTAAGLLIGGSAIASAPVVAAPSSIDQSFGKAPTPPKIDPAKKAVAVPARQQELLRSGAVVPPSTPTHGLKRAACSPPCYKYAGRARSTTNVSIASLNADVAVPSMDQQDYHTLWEMTIQNGCNFIELGWNRDRVLYGETYPTLTTRLFASVWYCNGGVATFCGYNSGCGYTDFSGGGAGLDLGTDISAANNTQKKWTIQHDDTTHLWWIAYDNAYVGSFPDDLGHSQSFTRGTLNQTFGEIALAHDPSCTDMMNSWLANAAATFPQTGSRIFSYNDDSATSGTLALAAYTNLTETTPAKWNVDVVTGSNYSYYAGGPGYSPNPGACP